MAVFRFNNIMITGISCAVPGQKISIEDYKGLFGEEEVSKFIQMTGVRESRRTLKHQTASDLGFAAALNLITKKKIPKEEIKAIIFGSHSPDYRRPATSLVLHKRLGLSTESAAFDINLGCSSLVYGIQVVASIMNNSDIEKALLIVGDTASKSVYPKDRSSVMIFGEAGAAILLEKTEQCSPIVSLMRSDGNGYSYMIIPAGGYRNLNATNISEICPDGNERTLYNSFMLGTSVFTFTISDVPKLIKDFWALTTTNVDDYDCYAFHQANLLILKQIAKKLKIPFEKMPVSIDRYGNTSGASAALSICDTYGNQSGSHIRTMICGFGIGLSWGVTSVEIDTNNVYPVIDDDTVFEEGIYNTPSEVFRK